MIDSQSYAIKTAPESSNEISKYFCKIESCKRPGPYTPLALRRHYEQDHYQCSIARVLAILSVKLQDTIRSCREVEK